MQTLSTTETLIIMLAIALATIITRFLPFWFFPDNNPVPPFIARLGRSIAPAMMGLLLVFCLKSVDIKNASQSLATGLALVVIALLHTWKRNALLSIACGTLVYVIFIRLP